MSEEWEEEYEGDSEAGMFRGLSIPSTGVILQSSMSVMFYAVVISISFYCVLAIYAAFFGPKDAVDAYGNKQGSKKKQKDNAAFKEYGGGNGPVEEESGLLGKVVGSVFKQFESAPPPPEPVSFTTTISCIPFGCPPARMAGAYSIDPATGVGFLYGGFDEKGFRDDMYAFDTGDAEWRLMPKREGEASPGPRVHVRMAATNGYLVLFGGSTQQADATDDLYVMDTRSKPAAWAKIDVLSSPESPTPKPRFGHSMCSFGAYVVIFGGLDSTETYLNDMWVIDTKDWDSAEKGFSWQYVQPKGSYWPKARDSHCMCASGNKLVLFGGYDGISSKVIAPGQIEVYDFAAMEWTAAVTCGTEPSAGPNCAVIPLGNTGRVCTITESNGGIFNAMHVLDMEEKPMQWSTVNFDWKGDWTMIPGLRLHFMAAYDEREGLVYVFGGKASGDDGMLHDTLICCNMADAAGIVPEEEGEEGEGEEEVEEGEEAGDLGEEGWAKSREEVQQAMKGTYLPGANRFSPGPAKTKKTQ
jgi:hypothetical protein